MYKDQKKKLLITSPNLAPKAVSHSNPSTMSTAFITLKPNAKQIVPEQQAFGIIQEIAPVMRNQGLNKVLYNL